MPVRHEVPCEEEKMLDVQRRSNTARHASKQNFLVLPTVCARVRWLLGINTQTLALRLAGSGQFCTGRIEVYYGGAWGTVCDNFWTLVNSQVVCRQMGCGTAVASRGGAFFGQGTGSILLDDVLCKGQEVHLWDCPNRGWNVNNCLHSNDAGVVCSGYTQTLALRLAGSGQFCTGRIEVYYGGAWGTVCDNFWTLVNSQVVCRQMGCGTAVASRGGAFFGQGTGSILLDDVLCKGQEVHLWDCPNRGWNVNNCLHSNDAGVVCSGTSHFDFSYCTK
ncbi:deleted in malignant brain tumors 1 protein-like [Ambystoma mexicanum]|uniref:deleted in malignant brain tumors 1 protein-like n=1 Tax=Ambystoma mexicanum TaxID=8296 RepID=UPI0037E7DCF0